MHFCKGGHCETDLSVLSTPVCAGLFLSYSYLKAKVHQKGIAIANLLSSYQDYCRMYQKAGIIGACGYTLLPVAPLNKVAKPTTQTFAKKMTLAT
jgi:hypothetical protein